MRIKTNQVVTACGDRQAKPVLGRRFRCQLGNELPGAQPFGDSAENDVLSVPSVSLLAIAQLGNELSGAQPLRRPLSA